MWKTDKIDQIAVLENQGVTMYNGMAILAREQGYDDVADHLTALAADEARHAGLYALLNGHIKSDFFEVLKGVDVGDPNAVGPFQSDRGAHAVAENFEAQ